jgi:peptidoglycan LD-endopeptidase CwlK
MPKSTTGANWRKIPRHQVEPDLADLIDAAADNFAIVSPKLGVIVTEGPRTHARQRELKRIGASRTLHSKHIPDLSPTKRALAVDVAITVEKQVRWDWPLYEQFALVVKEEAARRGLKVTWGGDWPRFRDGPHYQIDI